MRVYFTLLDLEYFNQGDLAICYEKKPSMENIPVKEYLILEEEVIETLGGGRYLAKKKV